MKSAKPTSSLVIATFGHAFMENDMRSVRLANRVLERLLQKTSAGRTYLLMRHTRVGQPKKPVAKVVFSALTDGGANANGKVIAKLFLPPFCDELRLNGFQTEWAWSKRELARRVSGDLPSFIVHLYGEDNVQILDDEIKQIEGMAAATFNSAETGPRLADKFVTQHALEEADIKVPPVSESSGHVRRRFGSKKSVGLLGKVPEGEVEDDFIRTKFIDTRITFKGLAYYTTIRLVCLDEIVLHAFPRARDVSEGDPDTRDVTTPLDADLIEHLHQTLVLPFEAEFASLARKLFSVWGHGFYCHDILIEGREVYVSESGFKLHDLAYTRHLEPIASQLPSQSGYFATDDFSRRSAKAFVSKCEAVLLEQN